MQRAKQITQGIGFLLLWIFVFGVLSILMIEQFWMASLGGFSTPPAIWTLARNFGVSILPLLLLLGGVPASIQIMRSQQWQVVAIWSFGICIGTWFVVFAIVMFGHDLFGWTW